MLTRCDLILCYDSNMSVRLGLGFLQFPFSSPNAFWRWVDQCEDTGVDSLWLSERIVSTQNYLEPMSALAAILAVLDRGEARRASQISHRPMPTIISEVKKIIITVTAR